MMDIAAAYPTVSFVISTYNRRNVLLQTLSHINECGLARSEFEILVVDNASPDGTADAVAKQFRDVRVFALLRNRGSCAKNIGVARAQGKYIVFLDDDSYPFPGAMQRMIRHFEQSPHLGAAVFTVTLPDGSRECSAYPNVFIGCGTGFRKEALDQVGLLPAEFFMQAEEYDLSLRLLQGGWDIQTFDDLHVIHLKTPNARRSWRTMRLDVRNNFIVATRYLPKPWLVPMTADWMRRYYGIAATKKQRSAFFFGLAQGVGRSIRLHHRRPVSDEVFEQFSRHHQIEQRMQQAKEELGMRSILLIDYGKNILPHWMAANKLGLKIVAIADNRLVDVGTYRGIPIHKDMYARDLEYDAAIISNSSPVHAAARASAWRVLDDRPVLNLLETQPALSIAPSAQHIGLAA